MKQIPVVILMLILCLGSSAKKVTFSTAGYYQIEESGRTVKSFNPGWKFKKGDVQLPVTLNYNDSDWEVVNLPHGIEKLPEEASGCINYQGVVWYRKQFEGSRLQKGKKHFLHFEAIMGKSEIYVNGKLLKEQFGGYLPAIVDITNAVNYEGKNIIAIKADNSNDPVVPPGKKQEVLDFTYFGGIYRDCWLISHNKVHITDANYENIVAGGGVVVSSSNVSGKKADVNVKYHVRNEESSLFKGTMVLTLRDKDSGKVVAEVAKSIKLSKESAKEGEVVIAVDNPKLWTPEAPELYDLFIAVKDKKGHVVDGYRKQIGIRYIELKGKDGLWLNGKKYDQKLVGANRHQDFATVGHALSNSLHWRDAKKLRDAGMTIIRNAHYPQDPAFMDACDQLGLFVIVNTPGWQWWSKEPIFEKRVYSDIRNMIRRDRNHASVFLWEPILNETWYPDYFAINVRDIVTEEFVEGERFSVCDGHIKSAKFFPVLFLHPRYLEDNFEKFGTKKNILTREWGDNVDSWSSHNSNSRVHLSWGEQPMLIQAEHYAKPHYADRFTCFDYIERMPDFYLGGCLWHSFDHQRGYHPDPFYGGIMNAFRYPKTSYHMFTAQRNPQVNSNLFDSGPMVHIAHEMTPFSNENVTVYSNCDSVTLKVFANGKQYSYKRNFDNNGIKYPIITFPEAWDFFAYKALSRGRKYNEAYMEAKGYINGELVATHKVQPSIRPVKIKLWVDDEGLDMCADGSDLVVVHAMVTDENGVVKRLNNQIITFELEGAGELVFPDGNDDNSVKLEYGVASVLVRSGVNPGKIKVIARPKYQGIHTPKESSVEIETQYAGNAMVFDADILKRKKARRQFSVRNNKKVDAAALKDELKKIEKQQNAFGEKEK
ncbi:glycoside hydrolase family 2 protein [Prolixibacteraceae bacterium JC049]|nr:glycoside hydrolase family 2 protein [Prolixibacteraceae bacterium JC049]